MLQMSDTLLIIIISVIVLDLAVVAYYYFRVFRPTRAVEMGMDLLRAQDFSSRLAPVGFRQADNLVAMFNEMLDRLKTERLKLEEQNYFLEQLIRVSPMGVILCDYDEKIISSNASALRFLEITKEPNDQLLGKKIEEIKTPLAEKIARLKIGEVETVRMNDAKIFRVQKLSFIDRGFARPFILIESLTEEVMEAEKRAYEKIIRMIAHEVNNTVAGVGSIMQSFDFEEVSEEGTGNDTKLSPMQVCNIRLQNLSQFITRFADVVKIPDPKLRAYNINNVIENSANFLQSLCSQHGISFSVSYAENPKTIHLDAPLFEQVLVNVVKNAIESIEEKMALEHYRGEVWINVSESEIEIIDNGLGISEETASRLFTPFFTTKQNGQGIGLLFVKEVLRKHSLTFSLQTDRSTHLTHFRISF